MYHTEISWGVIMAKKKRSARTSTVYVNVREVNWVVCLVMSIVFGWIGVDRFIMGKVGTGLLKLITGRRSSGSSPALCLRRSRTTPIIMSTRPQNIIVGRMMKMITSA